MLVIEFSIKDYLLPSTHCHLSLVWKLKFTIVGASLIGSAHILDIPSLGSRDYKEHLYFQATSLSHDWSSHIVLENGNSETTSISVSGYWVVQTCMSSRRWKGHSS